MENKLTKIIEFYKSCGFNDEQVRRELNSAIDRLTNGLNGVSYTCALDIILEDIAEMQGRDNLNE